MNILRPSACCLIAAFFTTNAFVEGLRSAPPEKLGQSAPSVGGCQDGRADQ